MPILSSCGRKVSGYEKSRHRSTRRGRERLLDNGYKESSRGVDVVAVRCIRSPTFTSSTTCQFIIRISGDFDRRPCGKHVRTGVRLSADSQNEQRSRDLDHAHLGCIAHKLWPSTCQRSICIPNFKRAGIASSVPLIRTWTTKFTPIGWLREVRGHSGLSSIAPFIHTSYLIYTTVKTTRLSVTLMCR